MANKTVYCVEVWSDEFDGFIHEEYYTKIEDAKASAERIHMENNGRLTRVVEGDIETLATDTLKPVFYYGDLKKRDKRREVMLKLEELVHTRYSKKGLIDQLNKIFGTNNIEVEWECYEDGGLSDYDAMFTTMGKDGVDDDIQGDFDIYWLPCKPDNMGNNELYITEVGYEFI